MTVLVGGSALLPPGTTLVLGGQASRGKKPRRQKKKKTRKEKEEGGTWGEVPGEGSGPGARARRCIGLKARNVSDTAQHDDGVGRRVGQLPSGDHHSAGWATASNGVKETRRPKKKKKKAKKGGTGCQEKALGLGPEPGGGGSDGAPSTIDAMEGVTCG
ncbi:hypothetical protein BKA56DRAFT_614381 [Ilyonectria sp. MPI-CAGE-AT-0026]|nr:hypothetical protein BKA56DRAFT_614381 [Ilyonectria sp. MPI-CAGE-AT-0026]